MMVCHGLVRACFEILLTVSRDLRAAIDRDPRSGEEWIFAKIMQTRDLISYAVWNLEKTGETTGRT